MNSKKFLRNRPNGVRSVDAENTPLQKFSLIAITVLFIFGASLLFRSFMPGSFLGDETRLIHQCKQNPRINPRKCSEILAARGLAKAAPSSSSFNSDIQKGFELSGGDDDIPARDLP
jgi:hypothetical protein